MTDFEWVLKSESATEKIYQIRNLASQYIRVCTPEANKQLNERLEILRKSLIVGFYQIKDIHQQKKYKSEDKEDFARISFKESLDKKFVDMGMSVRVQPLFNFVSECLNGDKLGFKKNPSGLVGKTIHVESFDLVDSTYKGETTKANKVRWSILDSPVTSEKNIAEKEVIDEFFDPDALIDYELYPDGFIVQDEIDPNDLEPDDAFNAEDFIGDDDFLPES